MQPDQDGLPMLAMGPGLLGTVPKPVTRRRYRVWLYLLGLVVSTAVLLRLYTYHLSKLGSRAMTPQEANAAAKEFLETIQHQQETLPGSNKACAELPIPAEYWSLDTLHSPFVDIPFGDQIGPGETVCVRVVVPPKKGPYEWAFMPLENGPWDSILLDLISTRTKVSVPVQLEMATHVHNYQRERTHVYQADVQLFDADTYRPKGYIEFRDALWNRDQDYMANNPFHPEPLKVDKRLAVSVVSAGGKHGFFNLDGYFDLPLCTEADNDGRWVSAEHLPFDPQLVPPPDNHNMVWLPYHCRLQRYTYSQFAQCLANKHQLVHLFGDSNIRRSLKKITTLGQWCSTPELQRVDPCVCNDNNEPFSTYAAYKRIAPFDLYPDQGAVVPNDPEDYATVGPNRTRVVAMKWDGLTDKNNPPWKDYFNLDVQEKLGRPTLVHIGVTNWSSAFESYQHFATDVPQLAQLIKQTYGSSIPIILRTGQYFYSSATTNKYPNNRFSRLRNYYMDQLLIAEFKRHFGTSVHVWDVSRITERWPREFLGEDSIDCVSSHARSEIVETENQVMFNALCNH
ncbi:hypothetical protein GGF46_004457 [Coemansia sp. RSA 552]|nr:hypothetical protein GGF46_004457 [Coemansia sp. RSA 552]